MYLSTSRLIKILNPFYLSRVIGVILIYYIMHTLFFVYLRSQDGSETHYTERFNGLRSVSDFFDWLDIKQSQTNKGKSVIINCNRFVDANNN